MMIREVGRVSPSEQRIHKFDLIEDYRKQLMQSTPQWRVLLVSAPRTEIAMRVGRGWWLACSTPAIPGDPDGGRLTSWPNRAAMIMKDVTRMLITNCRFDSQSASSSASAVCSPKRDFDEMVYQLNQVVA